jgi:4-amino-4-deoxy-L-arabinose transferase-like glycosyltransferase
MAKVEYNREFAERSEGYMLEKPDYNLRCRLVLAAFIFLVCVSDVLWIRLNVAPPRLWDDATYFVQSTELYQTLKQRGFIAFLSDCTIPVRAGHPPMIKILPVPCYLAFGPSINSALYAYTLLIPVFCIYLFLLTRALFRDERIATVAVMITCFFPLIFGLWRNLMMEFGMTLAVVAAFYHLVKSDEFRVRKHVLLLGFYLGWGLLWKILFPMFVAGPLLYVLVRRVWRWPPGERGPLTLNLMLLIACVCVVAGPFYWRGSEAVINFAHIGVHGEGIEVWGMGPVFSLRTLLRYWLRIINFGISVYFFALLSVFFLLYVARRRSAFPVYARWFLAAWFVLPFLIGSFSIQKDPRYTLAMFPVFGIVGAALLVYGLDGMRGRAQTALLCLLLAYPVYQFVAFSFDLGFLPRKDINEGPFLISVADLEMTSLQVLPNYAFPANRVRWPTREVMNILADHWREERKPRLQVMVDLLPYLTPSVFWYQSVLSGMPLDVDDPYAVNCGISRADFLVVLSGSSGRYRSLNPPDPELERLLDARQLPFLEIGRIPLPDQSHAVVYQRSTDSSTYHLQDDLMGYLAEQQAADETYQGEPVATFTLGSETRPVVLQNPGTNLTLNYVYVPDSGASLHVGVGSSEQEFSINCPRHYQITVSAWGEYPLLLRTIDPTDRDDLRWYDDVVPLTRFSGQIIGITLSTAPDSVTEGSPCNRIGWSHLRLVPKGQLNFARPGA